MATSPSNPYKSRFLRGVLRQARHWLDRGQTTLRQAQVVASWSVQILLYPIYAAFQTGRWVGNVIERSQDTAQLRELTPERTDIPLTSEAEELTAETPLQNVLQTIQTLELPANYAVIAIEPVAIRAIASQLETRSLVLVTNYNQIITLPDSQVQHWLKQRIIYEIALYNRAQRSRRLPGQRLLRLVQSIRHRIQHRLLPAQPLNALPVGDVPQWQPGLDLASDRPLRRSLLAVKEVLPIAQCSVSRPPQAMPIVPRSATLLPTSAPVQIRGVASLLASGKLALVSDTNEVLDILTPNQQAWLQQRITWERAHYRRYLELRHQTASLPPLRPPAADSELLPPVRAVHWLIAWMQSGGVARATNLFEEATWIACPLPIAASPVSPAIAPLKSPFALQLRSPSGLQLRNNGESPSVENHGSINRMSIVHRSFTAGSLDRLDENTRLVDSERSLDYLDIPATLMEYEQSWLERVMRWLDYCFVWIETTLSSIWRREKHDRHQ